MKTYVPDYYEAFRCLAGACRHTCCAGWEIDIDEESLAFYRTLPENVRQEIFSGIEENTQGAHFVLTEDERCPFLQRDGRCRLIVGYGEDILCDICADHPRFRNYFSGREEIGLGLCCEAAARLILSRKEKTKLILFDDDGEQESPPDEGEEHALALREKLVAIAQNREKTAAERVREIEKISGIPDEFNPAETAAFLKTLETMDPAWTELLTHLENTGKHPSKPEISGEKEIALEQLLVYLLFRHIPEIADKGGEREHVAFCTEMWRSIVALDTLKEESLAEICRLFSSEIEYSDENPGKIMEKLQQNFPVKTDKK